jgi:membrane-bound serine protease (ClpP class)
VAIVPAFSASVVGVLFIYWELIRPGTILPGSIGAILLLGGSYELWVYTPNRSAIAMSLAGTILIATELHLRARFVGGAVGLVGLTAGVMMLFGQELPTSLAVLGALLVGLPGFVLAVIARLARQRKQVSGLGNESSIGYVP